MKILYIHQYFKTPEEGGCVRSYHLAKGLKQAGHQVILITAHNSQSYRQTEIEGVKIHYLAVPYDNSFGYLRRIRSFFAFVFGAIRVSLKEKKIDNAYVMTTPLSTALVALFLKWFKGIPYYFEVGDLWPEVPVKMGILKNGILKRAAYLLEYLAYKNAEEIIGLSPDIADYIKVKHPQKTVHIIPNLSNLSFFKPVLKRHQGLKVLYCGTISVANHLSYLIDIAKESIANKLPIHFTIVGDGNQKNEIIKLVEDLPNVTILDFVNQKKLREIIDDHDAFYVSFMNIPALHTGSPNKYFDGLAAGKLMILNLGGWLEKLTELHQCGFAYNPDFPINFIELIKPFLMDDQLLKSAQNNARELANDYSVESAQTKLNALFAKK